MDPKTSESLKKQTNQFTNASDTMKYLVTGAKGQLGTEWVKKLIKEKVVFSSYGSKDLDITDSTALQLAVKEDQPDVIINCAAYTDVDGAETEPEKAFSVNKEGVKNLAECCLQNNIKLVHFSTDYVFPGNKSDEDTFPAGYPENADTNPVNMYGVSKLAGETELLKICPDHLLIRVSWLCGPTGSNFVKTMLRLAKNYTEIKVVDDQSGSPAFTFDVVEKTLALLRLKEKGCFHISSSGKITWADFAKEIFDQAGAQTHVVKIPSTEYKTVATRPAFSLLSNEKCTNLGLTQLYWKQGIKTLFTELDEHN